MKKTAFLSFISIFLIFTSCRKGCTDKDAENYDSKAKRSTSTCKYITSIYFWYEQDVSDMLILDGATSLTYFFDNQIIGSSSTSVYWTAEPSCGQTGVVNVTKKLGNSDKGTFGYKVVDQRGRIYWQSTLSFGANTCQPIKLTF